MRVVFLLVVLCVAGLYTYNAFVDLSFLSSTGRLGPGFFPRMIGTALVVVCAYSLVLEAGRQRRLTDDRETGDWGVTAIIAGLSLGFVLLLEIVGGLPAMILFMLASLSLLNRGRIFQNLAISLLLPGAIYFLFDVWLNASMPEGRISLPI